MNKQKDLRIYNNIFIGLFKINKKVLAYLIQQNREIQQQGQMKKYSNYDSPNPFMFPFEISIPKKQTQLQKDNYFNLYFTSIIIIFTKIMIIYLNSYLPKNIIYTYLGYHNQIPNQTTNDCKIYYCNQVAYNYLEKYNFYLKCNSEICSNSLCQNVTCSLDENDLNIFYNCCSGLGNPKKLIILGILSIISGIIYFSIMIFTTISGIIIGNNRTIGRKQKISLCLNGIIPNAKYFYFRLKNGWNNVRFNFRFMINLDLINCSGIGVCLIIYIYLACQKILGSIELIVVYFLGIEFIFYLQFYLKNKQVFIKLENQIKSL